MTRPLLVLASHEATRRIERTVARLACPLVQADPALLEAPPEALLAAAHDSGAARLLSPRLPLPNLLRLAEAHAALEAPPYELVAPPPTVLARLATPEALDEVAEELGLRRPRHEPNGEDSESPWRWASRIEVWAARGVDGTLRFLGEADTSLAEDPRASLAESPPPILQVRSDGEALREALREASRRILEEVHAVGLFGVTWLLDPDLRMALEAVQVGLPAWHAALEATTGVDLVESWLVVHSGEPPPEPSRTQRPDVHAVAAVVSGVRNPEAEGPPGLKWPPEQPGKVRIEPLRPLEPPWPEEHPAPLLRVTAMGTVRHHAIQRLDRALVSLQPRAIHLLVEPLRALLNHEIFRAGRLDVHLSERAQPVHPPPRSAASRTHKRSRGRRT